MVVLSNLIHNAIEACKKKKDPSHKPIRLNINANLKANFLYIENPTEQPVKIADNHIITSKKGKHLKKQQIRSLKSIPPVEASLTSGSSLFCLVVFGG